MRAVLASGEGRTGHRDKRGMNAVRFIKATSFTLAMCCALVIAVQVPSAGALPSPRGGQHDFDFESGMWRAHLSRLLHPLSRSNVWTQYTGTSIVRKVWNGRANLGEFDVHGPAGRIRGLSLRLYDPKSRQWNISWASLKDGSLGRPMVGGFNDGRGEFYDKEAFGGRPIFVRFIFSKITHNSFQLEQAFSADGGITWEANWITTFTRVSAA